MDNQFQAVIDRGVRHFQSFDNSRPVRVITHFDADGIAGCSIIMKLLEMNRYNYAVSVVQMLTISKIVELSKEDYTQYIFIDLGSSYAAELSKYLENRRIIILDHHKINNLDYNESNIALINPELVGIDCSKSISASGVSYLFAAAIDKRVEQYSYLAVIGAIGDMQDIPEFSALNKSILDSAVSQGKIIIKSNLRCFDSFDKPVYRLLEQCADPYIKGVTGSEQGAMKFLENMGISLKTDKGWKTPADLTDNEIKRLADSISEAAHGYAALGSIYILNPEEDIKDCRKFSTMLNACGKLGKPSLGIAACIGSMRYRSLAVEVLNNYKREIMKALILFEQNKFKISKEKKYMIINTESLIPSTIVGTLATILSKSGVVENGTVIVAFGYSDETAKASMRVAGDCADIDLKQLLSSILSQIGGESGGHRLAAGGVFHIDRVQDFINSAKEALSKIAMEERV